MRFRPLSAAALTLAAAAVALATACGTGAGGVSVTQVAHTPTAAAETPSGAEPTARGGSSGETPVPPTPAPTRDAEGAIVVGCGDLLAPLDKVHRLPADCEPASLELLPAAISVNGEQYLLPAVAAAFVDLVEAAADDGYAIYALSTYRSYALQQITFQQHVDSLGLAQAERVSARAGHSEHQLGSTVDVTSASAGFELVEAFGETAEGRWVAANAWRFGFVISYPAGKESVTGYSYEPWHLRWVGEDVAAGVRARGLTLHEFLLR